MPGTPDDLVGGETDADLIILNDSGADPANVGEFTNNAGVLKGKDTLGVFDLRSGGGLSTAGHKALRDLIHFIDDGPADGFASGAHKVTTGTVFPSAEVWWESVSLIKKVVSLDITWSGVVPATEVWKVYDTDGSTVLVTVTDTIVSSSIFESTRTRVIT